MKLKQLPPLLMLVLVLFHIACASSQPLSTLPHSSAFSNHDSGTPLSSVDVALQGLPEVFQNHDAGVSTIGLVSESGVNGEAIMPLSRGAQAPFNGVLFNGPAVARVAVEFQTQQHRCTIEQNRVVALFRARYNADISSLQLAMSTQAQTNQVILNSRDADIARLNRLINVQQRQNSGPHVLEGLVWAGGGLLVGALLVGGIVFVVNARP